MSFDQNMIIDATTGSIARFVNHSCNPNCRMIKWIVKGEPRMALFAGDRPIMTGDELTYDYNFDPFSQKNVQRCLCGEKNCRGVLGPRPKDAKPARTEVKETVKSGKRKLKEVVDEDQDNGAKPAKKRKMKVGTGTKVGTKAGSGVKKPVSKTSSMKAKAVRKAATPVKGRVVTAVKKLSARAGVASKASPKTTTKSKVKLTLKPSPAKASHKVLAKVPVRRKSTGDVAKTATRKSSSGRILKPTAKSPQQANLSIRASSLKVVAAAHENARLGKRASPKTPKTPKNARMPVKFAVQKKAIEKRQSMMATALAKSPKSGKI
jgi:[histone H3]-lysine4 N-trimethyltransferase ASH1L